MTNYILTLVAPKEKYPLRHNDIKAAQEITQSQASPVILAPGEAVEFAVEHHDAQIYEQLASQFSSYLDFALQPAKNRRKTILISDMDSTIVDNETLDEVARLAGIGEYVEKITARSMGGQQDFTHSLNDRVACLKGKPQKLLEEAWHHIRLIDGAKTLVGTMNKYGAYTVLISGGFTFFTSRIAKICQFDEDYANQFVFSPDGTFSGEIGNKPIDGQKKKDITREIARKCLARPEDILAIGDGSNDIAMLQYAGMGIAFHGKPIVREKISLQINHTPLTTALFMQGYPRTSFCQ